MVSTKLNLMEPTKRKNRMLSLRSQLKEVEGIINLFIFNKVLLSIY